MPQRKKKTWIVVSSLTQAPELANFLEEVQTCKILPRKQRSTNVITPVDMQPLETVPQDNFEQAYGGLVQVVLLFLFSYLVRNIKWNYPH